MFVSGMDAVTVHCMLFRCLKVDRKRDRKNWRKLWNKEMLLVKVQILKIRKLLRKKFVCFKKNMTHSCKLC